MPRFLMRWAAIAAAVAIAAWIVPGIYVTEPHRIWAVVIVALVLGLINAFIRPILYAMSCALIFLTLGLFTLIINGLMLWLASWVMTHWIHLGFHVDGFWNAVLGALIISVISVIVSIFGGERRRRYR